MAGELGSITPLKYERAGWEALLILATEHPDGAVRIDAAERLIRLGNEFRPDLTPIDFNGHQTIARIVEQAATQLIERMRARDKP
jgi:hypothetical protein